MKLLYATTAINDRYLAIPVPTYILFVNDKRLIGKDYLRYLENRLREALPFKDVPMHLVLRDKSDDEIPEED